MDNITMPKKLDIKAIFIDIDNTIFDHWKKKDFDYKSIKTLNYLHDRGIKIILSTARPIFSIREFGVFDVVKHDGLIAANGAVRVYNNKRVNDYQFNKKYIKELITISKKYKLTLELVAFDYRFYATPYTETVRLHYEKYKENISPFKEYDGEEINSICLYATEDYDQRLRKELSPEISLLRFSPYAIDVVDHLHNKGEGVITLLKEMNIDKKNALAFGDDRQDLYMFQEVEYGVAMGNSRQEVKNQAKYICKPVYQHGIYHYLRKIGLISLLDVIKMH